MDLPLYFRVLWRFRLLVLGGFILAVGLAFLSLAKVTFVGLSPKVSYRKPQYWQSQVSILLTQKGFPWGRSVYPYKPTATSGVSTTPFADTGRFSSLTTYYSQVATSDAVSKLMLKQGPVRGRIGASPGFDEVSRTNSLPFVNVFATTTDKTSAIALANRTARAMQQVVSRQQAQAHIPAQQRVKLQVFTAAISAKVVQPRKKTIPIVIFLTVMLAVMGLAFILENLRPRVRQLQGALEVDGSLEKPVAVGGRLPAEADRAREVHAPARGRLTAEVHQPLETPEAAPSRLSG